MKRVKFFFAALAVVATVSGALAFKAHKFGTGTLYCNAASGSACPTSKDYTTGGSLTMYCETTTGITCNTKHTDAKSVTQ